MQEHGGDVIPRDLSQNLKMLSTKDRALLYEHFLEAAAQRHQSTGKSITRGPPLPLDIAIDPRKREAWTEACRYLKEEVPKEGELSIWSMYEQLVDVNRSKTLGQYFTPAHVARFALSGIKEQPKRILDPMMGHGTFLKEAQQRFPEAKLAGVDIDRLPLLAARLQLGEGARLIQADVFDWARQEVLKNTDFSFSAIIGNPAYINYQNLEAIPEFTGRRDPEGVPYRKHILDTLDTIAVSKGVKPRLRKVFRKWSGFSDLSTYTLVLAWLLCKDEGQICFVMTDHWMERGYGEPLMRFLASKGTIQAIVTHRGGNWFPKAQIPTSVFVFSKKEPPERQAVKGVPFVEIHSPPIGDTEKYLHRVTGGDFWRWIDSLSSPCDHGPLRVTFRKWLPKVFTSPGKGASSTPRPQLPPGMSQYKFTPLSSQKWEVHQGLRTGCNEVFYVKRLPEQDTPRGRPYVTHLTKNGKPHKVPLHIPQHLILPAIKKTPRSAHLVIGKDDIDICLLNLKEALLEEDKNSLGKYPEKWLNAWGVDQMELIPTELSEYLRQCAVMRYERKGSGRKVADLSAVRTNIYRPPLTSRKIPKAPRFWYQISIQRRHFGEIIIPRVSLGPVRAYLVDQDNSVITDANFLTYISQSTSLPAKLLWIWFNSNAFRALCELNGVRLGGGALKLEAAIASRLPVPTSLTRMDTGNVEALNQHLKDLQISDERLVHMGQTIDSALFSRKIAKSDRQLLDRLMSERQKGA